MRVLKLPALFEHFLAHDLGLATSDDPSAQPGVWLNAPRSITKLVDVEQLRTGKGSTGSNQFMGWAVADPGGNAPAGTALEWLTQMCDHALYLDAYETTLAAIEQKFRSS